MPLDATIKKIKKVSVKDKYVIIDRMLLNKKDSVLVKNIRKGGLENTYNLFFPQVDIAPYKELKKEKITVPAGTFNCTVVVGTDYDVLYKYWLIDNKPGIFARIVVQKEEDSAVDYFITYDLLAIYKSTSSK